MAEELPPPLDHAGAVVDQVIEYLIDERLDQLAIASALLGGALGLLARTLSIDGVVSVLRQAIASAERGELHRMDRAPPQH